MRVAAALLIPVLAVLPGAASDGVRVEPQTILEQTVNLRPEVLGLALEAFEQATAEGQVRRPVLTIVDYQLPSYERRLWVIDMESGKLLHEEWVAHGMGRPRGSGDQRPSRRSSPPSCCCGSGAGTSLVPAPPGS